MKYEHPWLTRICYKPYSNNGDYYYDWPDYYNIIMRIVLQDTGLSVRAEYLYYSATAASSNVIFRIIDSLF